MTAHCVDGVCSTVQFSLEVSESSTVDVVRLMSSSSVWRFGSLLGVYDGNGADVSSSWSGGGTDMRFTSFSFFDSPTPLHLRVAMTDWGTTEQLHDGSLTYTSQGFNGSGQLMSLQGQVVPEPSTWILLATGLLGLGFFARRRREGLTIEA